MPLLPESGPLQPRALPAAADVTNRNDLQRDCHACWNLGPRGFGPVRARGSRRILGAACTGTADPSIRLRGRAAKQRPRAVLEEEGRRTRRDGPDFGNAYVADTCLSTSIFPSRRPEEATKHTAAKAAQIRNGTSGSA